MIVVSEAKEMALREKRKSAERILRGDRWTICELRMAVGGVFGDGHNARKSCLERGG